jgi:hypothetical protein
MTEAQWQSSTDIGDLVEFALRRVSGRKLRCFAVACCRRVWADLYDIERQAVEVVERLLEGEAGEPERAAAYERLRVPAMRAYGRDMSPIALDLVDRDPRFAAEAVPLLLPDSPARALEEEAVWVGLLRDIVGPLPFRPAVLDSALRTSTVIALATGIYAERAFDRAPILADALEDAGCADDEVLDHLRGPNTHIRGCWVIDLLLAKE